MIKVNQALCAGCGICADVCPNGAITLLDYRAVIDQSRCTACQACVSACPNDAIIDIPEPVSIPSGLALPVTQAEITPLPTPTGLPEKAAPTRGLIPLLGAALVTLGSELAPRLADLLVSALERRLARPSSAALVAPTSASRVLMTQGTGRHIQSRQRRGGARHRIQRGRR